MTEDGSSTKRGYVERFVIVRHLLSFLSFVCHNATVKEKLGRTQLCFVTLSHTKSLLLFFIQVNLLDWMIPDDGGGGRGGGSIADHNEKNSQKNMQFQDYFLDVRHVGMDSCSR